MTETPTERAERVEFLYEKCKRRGGGSMADVETLRNDVREFAAENKRLAAREAELEGRLAQLRHIINDQAHRIQGGLDRIAELEAERDATKTVGEQCTATTGRRLVVQCGREAGHDAAHTAEVGGGRISWHGDTTPAGA